MTRSNSLAAGLWAALALTLSASTAFAHGDLKPRFVAVGGVDSGDCTDASAPCGSIMYAIKNASKGDFVALSKGTYEFDPKEAILLVSDVVPVVGGYRQADGFLNRDVASPDTYVIGAPARMRERLAERGISLIADRKGLSPKFSKFEAQINAVANAPARVDCVGGRVGPFECDNINLLGLKQLSTFSTNPSAANDIWGFVDLNNGREYALIGLRNAMAVVDITRPRRPREVGSISGASTTWRDIKVVQSFDENEGRWKGYAYVVSDATSDGLQIIDLSGLPFSISLANTYREFNSAHNIYISNVDYTTGEIFEGQTPYAYILGSNRNGGAFRALDLSDPVNPVEVTPPPAGSRYVHDASSITLQGEDAQRCGPGRTVCEVFIDYNESTVDLWDTTDKANPVLLSQTSYPQVGYTHSGWWSKNADFVLIQDELDESFFGLNTTLRILDIRDLTNPTLAGEWVGPTRAIDHNGFVKGDRYYMSNYRRGLTILDISNPAEPTEIGFFDTFPDSDSASFNGAWGVYPYLPSGRLIVSDIERGLVILREADGGDGAIGGKPVSIGN
ncbi:MAG: choice-of-anchor B family protein [Pseudomonadota bacterium]